MNAHESPYQRQGTLLEPNETILELARRNGIFIPTLCELNDIDHTPGTCRVCLVEVQQAEAAGLKYMTACDTPMTEGWKIMTRTPKVQEMRQLQMEMIMADHHQDCASCPRSAIANCWRRPAQFGLKQVRFHYTEGWENLEPDHGSQPVIYDRSRCMRCQRCVAVCRTGAEQSMPLELTHTVGQRCRRPAQGRLGGRLAVRDLRPVRHGLPDRRAVRGAAARRQTKSSVMLADPEIVTVFQTAPAIRVGIGEEFGLPAGTNVEGQIVAALRLMGADVILDTNFGADVVIMEEGTELLGRLKKSSQANCATSCCPAWINLPKSTTRKSCRCSPARARRRR